MICNLLLWTEAEQGNVARAKATLKDMGLVPAKFSYRNPNSETYDDVMVWEDPQEHIGRYRVHTYEHHDIKGQPYDIINFHYWWNKRSLKREIIEQEPMDEAVQRVLGVLQGKIEVQNWNTKIAPVEEVVKKYFS
jgi:hypothetical protein